MEREIKLAYLCFLDLVGYSKRNIAEQSTSLQLLQGMIKDAIDSLSMANADSVVLPTGDGIALCFWDAPENAILFALEFNRLLYEYNERAFSESRIEMRTGIHFGPVVPVIDLLGRKNVVGAGLIIAQRVMDLAAPNQILASDHVYQLLSDNDSYRSLFRYLNQAARGWHTQAALSSRCFSSSFTAALTSAV
jgi:class 3 adenylate cyclase